MTANVRIAAVSLLVFGCAGEAAPPAEGENAAVPTDRIGVAMSAAPSAISSAATIMDLDEAGGMIELRAGANGWLCIPDDSPVAAGDAPMCMDEAWQAWFDAWAAKETPQLSGVGISYMLQGGPAASNTDPFAETPAPGEDWIQDGPHIMVIVPDPSMLDAFPTDPASGGPYVMWKGTPYAHLMVPATEN